MQPAIKKLSGDFGSQSIVLSIQAKKVHEKKWISYYESARENSKLDVIDWAQKVETFGAGEILLTSIDKDGTKDGYDTLLTQQIVNSISIPVIASGGCGSPEHMIEIFKSTEVSAALAASIFHYEHHSVDRVKQIIKNSGIQVRY